MFEATLNEIPLLRDSIAVIAELIDEAELHVKAGGLKMLAADRAVVAVVDFFLSKDVFSEYIYDSDSRFGINMEKFLQVLKRAKDDDILKIKLEEGKLNLILSGSQHTRKFAIPLIDVSREETPPLDKLSFPASLKINAGILNNGIEDAELVADSIVFTVRKDQLMMKAESDSSSAQLELPSGTESLKIIDIGEPVRARYSLDYLKKMIKARKLSDEATISMATDYPMKLGFSLPGKMQMDFILAPRVEE